MDNIVMTNMNILLAVIVFTFRPPAELFVLTASTCTQKMFLHSHCFIDGATSISPIIAAKNISITILPSMDLKFHVLDDFIKSLLLCLAVLSDYLLNSSSAFCKKSRTSLEVQTLSVKSSCLIFQS